MNTIKRSPCQTMSNNNAGNGGSKPGTQPPCPAQAPDLHILREWNLHRERILHTRVHLL